MTSAIPDPGTGKARPVAHIVTAHQQKEGAGFLVRRPVPTRGLDQVDPFLMLNEIGPITYAHIEINPDFNVAAYVFGGASCFGPDRTIVQRGQMAVMGGGSSLLIHASPGSGAGRFLLLAGELLREPVSRHGPFVMNTHDELISAMKDYPSGKMGTIRRE